MFKQRQQRHRRGILCQNLSQQQQHPACCGLRQGPASGIIRLNPPTPQVGDNPARQPAIRRYQRDPPLWLGQGLTNQDRNGLGFLARMRGFHQPHARHTAAFGRQVNPAGASRGRQEQAGNGPAPGRRRSGDTGTVPRLDFTPRHAHPVQQQLQMVLRVGHCIIEAKWRIASLLRGAGHAEPIPDLRIEGKVEVGENHCAARQFRDHPEQPRQGRRSAGDACGHDRICGRIFAPAPGRMVEQQIAPGCGIDLAASRELRLPDHLRLGKITNRPAPMFGLIADNADHPLGQQLLRTNSLGQQPVHRPPGLKGLAQQGCPVRGFIAHDFAQDISQPQPAPDRIGGRWNVRSGTQRIEQRAERLVNIKIADHCHSGQEQAALRQANKGLGYDPHRPSAGQKQGKPGKADVALRIAGDQSSNQRIGKAAMRGDRIEPRARLFCLVSRVSHRQAVPRSARWRPARRLRTIGPYAPVRRAGPRQSPVPTGPLSKTDLRAHRAASGARQAECRYR